MSDAQPQRDALLATYRHHTGPPPGAEARLLAALERDIGTQHMAAEPGPMGHVPAVSPMIALARPRAWRMGLGLLVAAAVVAAVGSGLGVRGSRERDPAAAFHGAPEVPNVATPRPDLRILEAPPRANLTGDAGPLPTTGEPAAPQRALAPSLLTPAREPRARREPAPAPAPARTLADEMRRMRPAQRALAAGDPVAALAELERYALEFPDGHLREEYLAMRAIARCDAGHAAGRREADEFLRARPLSLFAGRVRSACATP